MKKFEGYICEECGNMFHKEKDAEECEKSHVDIKQLKIELGWFNSREKINEDNYYSGKGKLKDNIFIPQTLKIRYKEKDKTDIFSKSFIAYYELKKFDYRDKE